MARYLRLILAALGCCCPLLVHAACYQYSAASWSPGTGWLDSPDAVCGALRDHDAGSWTTLTFDGFTPGSGFPESGGDCKFTANGSIELHNFDMAWRINPDGCPPPEDCDSYENPFGVDTFALFAPDHGPDNTCHGPSGCMATRTKSSCLPGGGADACVNFYSFSSRIQCDTSEGQQEEEFFDGQSEGCAAGDAGEFCQSSSQGENCGYLNDQFICLGKTGDDNCNVMADGSRVCGTAAPMPPVPDNGTPGTPATPDGTITINNGSTFNFFNTTTVAGSSRPPGTTGQNPYNGSSPGGVGDGEGEGEEGDEAVSGGASCESLPVCEGDVIDCALLEQEWRQRCITDQPSGDALLAAIGLPGAGDEYGSIPTTEVETGSFDGTGFFSASECIADFEVDLGDYGTIEVPMSEFCTALQGLGFVLLALAYFQAARIVMGV